MTDQTNKDLLALFRLAPEPVAHPSSSWTDEYAEWHRDARAALSASAPAAGSVPSDSELMFVWSQTPNTGDMRIDLVAYARALLAQYGSPAWQPIETATMPKIGDTGYGERILLVVDCGPDTLPSVRIGWWSGHEWASDTGFTSLPSLGYRVTHWMPLPPAPQEGK